MKINAINEYRIEVELESAEMERLGLSFEAMDWSDIETRRALWSVLGLVRERGFLVDPAGKLLIEAGKTGNGVRLCFTALPPRGADVNVTCLKREKKGLALRFASFSDLCAAAAFLPPGNVEAYRRGNDYFLLPGDTYGDTALARAAEFGTVVQTRGPVRPIMDEYCERVELSQE